MLYRILVTLLLVAAIVGVGVYLEPPTGPQPTTAAPPSSADDSAMKSLRLP